MSKRRARASRIYAPMAEAWKAGKGCCCAGLRVAGRLICREQSHACEDVHHARGRLGPLLLDQRFWKPVCRKAHNFLGNNPNMARALGLLCQPGEWNTAPREEAA